MATNPMQRKARNSFLLGMLVMLLISGIIIGGLAFLLITEKKENDKKEKSLVEVCVLNKDIKSGNSVSIEDLMTETKIIGGQATSSLVSADAMFVPENAATQADLLSAVAKINLKSGTILTTDMISNEENTVYDDTRLQEYNMLSLPVKLNVDDYIDIRLTLPNGLEYIVLSKKRVLEIMENTIWLRLSQDEILTMSNAIVEAYTITGSKLSADLYIEPGLQKAAVPTYAVSQAVLKLIENDPNIRQAAKTELFNRYTQAQVNQRQNQINSVLEDYAGQAQTNIETKFKEEEETRAKLREKYIEQLNSPTTVQY